MIEIMSGARHRSGRFRYLLTVPALAGAIGFSASGAGAASLEQKWRAGEQLSYDVTIDGTMMVETDAAAPILFAGIPLDVKITGGANVVLDTRQVAPDGAATIALSLPQVRLKATAWEQVATLDARQGLVGITFNGRTLGKNTQASWLLEPPYALQVSKNAHIERIVPLAEETAPAPGEGVGAGAGAGEGAAVNGAGAVDGAANDAVNGADAPAPAPAPAAGEGLPINVAGLMRAMALQLLPALWPGRDVAPGETWSIESRLPVPSRNAAAGPALEMLSLGKFQLTLGIEEEVDGRRVYPVALQGLLDLDKGKASRLGTGEGTRLTSAAQKVNGTIWFDSAAGQLVKADLRLSGSIAGIVAMPRRKADDKQTPFAASERFDGVLKVQLKSVTMKEAPLAALPQ